MTQSGLPSFTRVSTSEAQGKSKQWPVYSSEQHSYMVLGYNAYNSAIMPDNGLITDHNCYRIWCDRDQVVKPTPDQLVGGLNPTRTSSPGTPPPRNESIGVKSTKPKNGP